MLTAVVGDWFLCDTPDCSVLRNRGAQWSDVGLWNLLEVRDAQSLEPTGMYCTSTHDANHGPYTFDEGTGELVMTDDLGRDAGAGTMTFTPPTATFVQDNGSTSLYIRIDPPRLSGPCPVSL
jgi:hypothetical protein